MITLYYLPGACSLASHLALKATEIAHELVPVGRGDKKLPDGSSFLTVNPLGYVPALKMENGEVLTEGVVILQYIADLAPEKKLMGKDASARLRVLQALTFISSEIHKGFSPLFHPQVDDAHKALFRARLQSRLQHLETNWQGDFLVGELSVADFYLFTTLRWAGVTQVDLSAMPKIQAFMTRIQNLPFVALALQAEGIK
jgi:glutathione S-transferase